MALQYSETERAEAVETLTRQQAHNISWGAILVAFSTKLMTDLESDVIYCLFQRIHSHNLESLCLNMLSWLSDPKRRPRPVLIQIWALKMSKTESKAWWNANSGTTWLNEINIVR
ncbi:hypothetical protein KL905_003984 [Ogataea polymorpha]|nr:hypothetical protein KL907_004168 [Ogataea polymorpha]KAG7918973.1 hypothetical protein KL905_003984 [Ogataea polymorpha]